MRREPDPAAGPVAPVSDPQDSPGTRRSGWLGGVSSVAFGDVGAVIVTEGTGWVEQTADQAQLDLTYDARGRSRAAAVEELGKRVSQAEPAFALPGVNVRHRRLWVNTEWRGGKPGGCRATESISLKVTDLAVLEELLGVLVGSEPASLGGPYWALAEPEALLAQAQQRAVADARQRAEGYAAALDGSLGELRRLSEASEPGPAPRLAMRAAAPAESAPDVRNLGLEPEPVRVSARCTTTWSFIVRS